MVCDTILLPTHKNSSKEILFYALSIEKSDCNDRKRIRPLIGNGRTLQTIGDFYLITLFKKPFIYFTFNILFASIYRAEEYFYLLQKNLLRTLENTAISEVCQPPAERTNHPCE